jgi:hypothetical protein
VRDASPAFQPDRPGAPGFQLAEDLGFQTQTPAWVGELEAVVTLDSPVAHFSGGAHAYVGELEAVVTLESPHRFVAGTPPFVGAGGAWIYPLPRRYAYVGELEAVVTLESPHRFVRGRPRPVRRPRPLRRIVVGALAGRGLELEAVVRHRDGLRDVILPDDAEALELLVGLVTGLRAALAPTDDEEVLELLMPGGHR